MKRGDSCNTFNLALPNHYGTHVDCPAHFFEKGLNVAQIKADFWWFRSPQVVSVKLRPGELLGVDAVEDKIKRKTDLLLFKSGWSKMRERREYSVSNPGIDPSLGYFLRAQFPQVRAVGLDWISVSSYLNREEGREAHRAFLNPHGKGRPIVLIEDMDLRKAAHRLKQVFVFPLRIDGIDSAPCTVVGKFSNGQSNHF